MPDLEELDEVRLVHISADFDAHVRKWGVTKNQEGTIVGYAPTDAQVRQLRSFVLATHRKDEHG